VYTSIARAVLFLCVAASAVAAEPPEKRTSPQDKGTDGMPPPPAIAADASPLRKAQLELVREGLAYIKRCKDLIRADAWVPSDFRKFADVLTETCRVAAELEEKSANRVPWFESRVRQMKEVEDLIDRSVRSGNLAPQELTLVRFQRLQAEVDLLKIKAEMEKAKEK
jgi:hypothetical protein